MYIHNTYITYTSSVHNIYIIYIYIYMCIYIYIVYTLYISICIHMCIWYGLWDLSPQWVYCWTLWWYGLTSIPTGFPRGPYTFLKGIRTMDPSKRCQNDLDSQLAGHNRPLYPKVDHYWFKVAHNYEPLALWSFSGGSVAFVTYSGLDYGPFKGSVNKGLLVGCSLCMSLWKLAGGAFRWALI